MRFLLVQLRLSVSCALLGMGSSTLLFYSVLFVVCAVLSGQVTQYAPSALERLSESQCQGQKAQGRSLWRKRADILTAGAAQPSARSELTWCCRDCCRCLLLLLLLCLSENVANIPAEWTGPKSITVLLLFWVTIIPKKPRLIPLS